MCVARDHALPMVDPHLSTADSIERRRGRIAEGQRLVKRHLLLLAIPIEKAHVDASHGPAAGRQHRSSGWGGEVDALVDTCSIVSRRTRQELGVSGDLTPLDRQRERPPEPEDRKSTRLNSSHRTISYAVFCLKKKRKRP